MNTDLTWWKNQAGRIPRLTDAEEITLGTAIREWQDHPSGPSGAPKLLQRRGKRARDRMICGNLRLVVSYVGKLRPEVFTKCPAEDLIQAGNDGLTRAAEKFDPAKGYKFSTYAYWWIRQAVTKARLENDSIVSQPRSHAENRKIVGMEMQRLVAQLKRMPTEAEIREAIVASGRLSNCQITEIVISGRPVMSIDAEISENLTLADTIASPDDYDEEQNELMERLAALPPDLYKLIHGLYGLNGEKPWTLPEAAKAMGLSRTALHAQRRRAMMLLRIPAKCSPCRPQSAPNRPPPPERFAVIGQHSLSLKIGENLGSDHVGGSDLGTKSDHLCHQRLVSLDKIFACTAKGDQRSQPVRSQRRQLIDRQSLDLTDPQLHLQITLD